MKFSCRAFCCFLLLTFGLCALTWAQPRVPANAPRITLVEVDQSRAPEAGKTSFSIPPAAYQQLWRQGSALIQDFPLPGRDSVILELVATQIIAPNAKFMVNDETGMYEHPAPKMRFFRGKVAGESDSLVSLNLFQGRIGGFVRIGADDFSFGPKDFDLGRAGAHDLSIKDELFFPAEGSVGCSGEELVANPKADFVQRQASSEPPTPAIDGSTVLQAYTAVEGTAEWVAHHGSVGAAETYTTNLIAQISAYWETDVLVKMQIPFSLMNASAATDGYTDGSESTSTLLADMRAKWRTNGTLLSTFRTNVQLFSHRPSGGGSGLAARANGLLCGHTDGASANDFGVDSISGLGGSWEKRMVGHEIGHNYSSPHTHCFVPEIDQCDNNGGGICFSGTEVQVTGTMMSYCDTRLSVIHSRVKDEQIRPNAEAAYPTCVDAAGGPGDVRHQLGSGLTMGSPTICGSESFQNDDGSRNGFLGFGGTTLASWMKRFTPSCYPFKLDQIQVMFSASNVAAGRNIQLFVGVDPSGSSNQANASLAYTQNETIQTVSTSVWNTYTLSTPVMVTSGEVYLGVYDQDSTNDTNHIMDYDTSVSGDSWYSNNTNDPASINNVWGGTSWMIRGSGTGVSADSLQLSWGAPCNNAEVPGQDFAVYQGTIGTANTWTSLTCSTGGATTYLIESPANGVTWIVVPGTSVVEGSYGQDGSGSERSAASSPCLTQSLGTCP